MEFSAITQVVNFLAGLGNFIYRMLQIFLLLGRFMVDTTIYTLNVISYLTRICSSGLFIMTNEFAEFLTDIHDLLSCLFDSLLGALTRFSVTFNMFLCGIISSLKLMVSSFVSFPLYVLSLMSDILLGVKKMLIFVGDTVALITYKGPFELLELCLDLINFLGSSLAQFVHGIFSTLLKVIIVTYTSCLSCLDSIRCLEFQDVKFLIGWLILLIGCYCLYKLNLSYSVSSIFRRILMLVKFLATKMITYSFHACGFIKVRISRLLFRRTNPVPIIVRNFENGNAGSSTGSNSSAGASLNSSFDEPQILFDGSRQRRVYRAPEDSDESYEAPRSGQRAEKQRQLVEMESLMCVICLDRNRKIAVFPCRHMCMCEVCGPKVVSHDRRCPVCREVIVETCLIYI